MASRDNKLVNLDGFKKDVGGLLNRFSRKITNKLEDKLENAVEDLFAKGLKKIGLSDSIAAELSSRFGDALTSGLEDKYFQTFTSEMKRASCADIRNNFNPRSGNIVGAAGAAETYVDAIRRASNKVTIDGLPTLQFPNHISDSYFMAFKFKQYQRPAPEVAGQLNFVQAFALPLPKGIRETFEISIDQESTGMTGGVADAVQQVLATPEGGKAQATKNAAIALLYSKAVQATGDLGRTVGQVTGAVPNPHVQALFSGVPLRQHRFEWTFAPRNESESRQLMAMLNAMKAFSLPAFSSLGTAALAYPFLCQPEMFIGKNKEMIMFSPCLIQSVEINYAPQGLPAFFEDTHLPAFIEVSISMLETEMQTADRYGRTGGDRLEEMADKIGEILQKGLDAAGAGFDLNDGLKDLNDSIVKGLSSSSSAETPARTGT
jgi:hypothetical protein